MREHQAILTKDTRLPAYVLISAVSLAIYGTALYFNLKATIESASRDAFTERQYREGMKDLQILNPDIRIPPFPEKHTTSEDVKSKQPIILTETP